MQTHTKASVAAAASPRKTLLLRIDGRELALEGDFSPEDVAAATRALAAAQPETGNAARCRRYRARKAAAAPPQSARLASPRREPTPPRRQMPLLLSGPRTDPGGPDSSASGNVPDLSPGPGTGHPRHAPMSHHVAPPGTGTVPGTRGTSSGTWYRARGVPAVTEEDQRGREPPDLPGGFPRNSLVPILRGAGWGNTDRERTRRAGELAAAGVTAEQLAFVWHDVHTPGVRSPVRVFAHRLKKMAPSSRNRRATEPGARAGGTRRIGQALDDLLAELRA